ncbi:MAG: 3-oxoadipate enol-lactonase [Acidimicrobiaceae bacterium]|nr:3-oxoadipate enol-lactonase [Acidimicrobiaceae bacterium]
MPRLGYQIVGTESGPPLILSNSLGTTMKMWSPQLAQLMQYFQVIQYDTRGHGLSSVIPGPDSIRDLAEDVINLADDLRISRFSFVGLSLGGMTGMYLASNFPERIEKLVLCCASPRMPSAAIWEERAQFVRANGAVALIPQLLKRWFTPDFVTETPQLADLLSEMLETVDGEAYASCCGAIAEMDLWDSLPKISAATLVIAGSSDLSVTPLTALEMQQAIPEASLAVIANSSHLVNIERPAEFSELLLNHLLGTSHQRGSKIRRMVLGNSFVENSLANANDFSRPLQEMITNFAWGSVWSRPGLDLRSRSIATVAVLAALGRLDELELHVRGALNNGLSEAEISEVLLQVAVYAGIPAANTAFKIAKSVIEQQQK